MGTTYRAVKGTKLTIVEGDDSREWSSESGTKGLGEDLTFDRAGGWFHATSGAPETGVLTIDETVGISKAGVTGARPGTWVMFYYSGSSNPTFTGNTGAVTAYQTITTAGTYECWMARKADGTYSLSIPQAASGGTDTTPPTVTSMSVEDASPNNLVVNLSSACTFTNIGYTFRVNGVERTLTSVSGNGTNTATFLISGAAILDTDTLDLAYDSTTGDTIKTSNSVELVTFAATTVTNNVLSGVNYTIAGATNPSKEIDINADPTFTGNLHSMLRDGSRIFMCSYTEVQEWNYNADVTLWTVNANYSAGWTASNVAYWFNADGTRIYSLSSLGVLRYRVLSTAYLLSSVGAEVALTSITDDTTPKGAVYYGGKLFVIGDTTQTLRQYTFDLATGVHSLDAPTVDLSATLTQSFGLGITPDGSKLVVLDRGSDTAYEVELPTPGVLTGASTTPTASLAIPTISQPSGMIYPTAGGVVMIGNATDSVVEQRDLVG